MNNQNVQRFEVKVQAMSENLKTIKELADELGVSKQNLQYHVKFLPTKKRQKNESGIVVLNIEEQMFISGRIKKK